MDKCKLTCTSNGITMEADVLSFKEEQFLSVAIAEMKISMKFNGKLYEGKAAGMDFTTPGPKVTKQYSR
jgi:hypothetical protein